MKKHLLLFLLLFFTYTANAQIFVGDNKGTAKIYLNGGFRKFKKNSIITETDSSYTFLLRGEVKPQDVHLSFDHRGICVFEKWNFDCDECYQQLLKDIFDKKRFKWKSVGNNEYLSKTSRQLKLKEYPAEHIITITQLFMRDQDYDALYNPGTDK